MAFNNRPAQANPAQREHPFAKVMAAVLFALLSYGALTKGAAGPGPEVDPIIAPMLVPVISASLNFSGADVTITGSVGHLFANRSFTGPNRAEKRDRAIPPVDALALSRGFNEVRLRLTALRSAPPDPTDAPQSRLADGVPILPPAEEGPRISIASLDSGFGQDALDAIQNLSALDPNLPIPSVASMELAYARANAPVTEFPAGNPAVSERELWCLATGIYFEARGESYRGQVAVAQVIMNRVAHRLYPDTICGVVFQGQERRNSCQFSFACDGQPESINDRRSWTQAEEIAGKVTSGELYLTEVANATHYHASYVYPYWAPRMTKITKIGLHIFYKFRARS